jgi:hypothetical protein
MWCGVRQDELFSLAFLTDEEGGGTGSSRPTRGMTHLIVSWPDLTQLKVGLCQSRPRTLHGPPSRPVVLAQPSTIVFFIFKLLV